MKNFGRLLIVTVAAAIVPTAGAAVLAGIYDFEGRKSGGANPVELANQLVPGMLGWVESPVQASTGSGGDTGGIYGSTGGATAVSPGLGDGFATVRVYAPNAANPNLTTDGSSILKFFVQNTSNNMMPLDWLFFDAAATTGQFNRLVDVSMVTGAGTTLLGSYGPLASTDPQNFSDYDIALNYSLAAGETVHFVFNAAAGSAIGTTLWVDNIAVGPAVPEPSTVAMGSLLALGLCFRRRRA